MSERPPDSESSLAPRSGSEHAPAVPPSEVPSAPPVDRERTRPNESRLRTQAAQSKQGPPASASTAPPPLPGSAPVSAPPAAPQASAVDAAIGEEPEETRGTAHYVLLQLPSWLASMVVHLALVLLLALVTFGVEGRGGLHELLISVDSRGTETPIEQLDEQMMESDDSLQQEIEIAQPETVVNSELDTLSNAIGLVRPDDALGQTDLGAVGGAVGDVPGGSSLALRMDGAIRAQMLREAGGTPESEEAVQRALYWLAEHQLYDGSWQFQHQKSPKCHGACTEPGTTPGKIAATALALLPFLGSGQTHLVGTYRTNIDRGLRFLVRSIEIRGDLGSLYEQGGQMYGHGLASIALCEAYGMTRDPTLREAAQASVNYIAEAQDPSGGGWRYMPQQPGDTSVVGWQLMALKSAQMAYLRVPPGTMRKANYFLDHVQSDRGAVYGYQRPERGRPATTAIGLLCRMYLGWSHDQRPLRRGVNILATMGPSTDDSRFRNNMYYNYYATQVMRHYGGSDWKRWNEVMREYLIKTQATKGHETGSWFFHGTDHGTSAGGRLYFTALAAMTLEVYYRHMPLYRPQSTQTPPE